MGYKMKGFSYPGKSPVKHEDDGLGGVTVGQGAASVRKTYLEDKYTEEGVSKKEGMPEGTEEHLESQGEGYNIWKDPKLKKSITDPVAKKEIEEAQATEGLVGDEMATSKAEIKQRKTISKTKQKASTETDEARGFGKVAQTIRQTGKERNKKEGKWIKRAGQTLVGISGKERKANKIQKLKDKEKLARATGKLSVTVDPLTGFKVGPQADKLAKRIKKKEAKIDAKKTRKATKKIKTDAKTKTK